MTVIVSNNLGTNVDTRMGLKQNTAIVAQPKVTSSNNDEVAISKKSEKVGFKETFGLLAQGFKDKLVNIGKNIVQHPLKTISAMALTTGALCALPFVGVSVATGSAFLAVLLGMAALWNTTTTAFKACKQSKNQDYDGLRQTIHKLGGCGVDLALTLPWLPKAVKQIKLNFNSYTGSTLSLTKDANGKILSREKSFFGGTKSIKYNPDGSVAQVTKNSLYKQMKAVKTWKQKMQLLFRQDTQEIFYSKLNEAYIKTAKERGFINPKGIKMTTRPYEEVKTASATKKQVTCGFVKTAEPDVVYLNKMLLREKNNLRQMIETIGHEHRHVEQNSMMARTEGLTREFENTRLTPIHHRDGIIKRGTEQAKLAERFYKAKINYVSPEKNRAAYYNNLLEVDARKVGETTIAKQIRANFNKIMGFGDKAKKVVLKYNPASDIAASNAMLIGLKTES